ncbi:MAG: hypothetical protein WC365_04465 [Candidatus Babeliales bacterium]|jgi:hypothetical protein
MKKFVGIIGLFVLFSYLNAMQSSHSMYDQNKVICCALCQEPIEQGGRCAKFLNKLFHRMTSVQCPIPDCVVVCHPSCLQQHLEYVHHNDEHDVSISSPCDIAFNVVSGCAYFGLVLSTIAIGCAGVGILAYPLYTGGRMVFGGWFNAPFVVWMGYEWSQCMAEAADIPRLKILARAVGALLGASTAAFDIWLYNVRNSAL